MWGDKSILIKGRKEASTTQKNSNFLIIQIWLNENITFNVTAKNRKATIVVRVGNNRPDLGVNPICNRFTGTLEEGRPLFLPCNPPMPGAFVSVHFEAPAGVSLSICETFVYTDQVIFGLVGLFPHDLCKFKLWSHQLTGWMNFHHLVLVIL